MIQVINFLVLAFLFIGCASTSQPSYSIKEYQGINKDDILHAGKKVFLLSDSFDYVIDSYRDELNVSKTKPVYEAFSLEIQNDHFNLQIKENNSTVTAKFMATRSYGIEHENRHYIHKDHDLHALFWQRLEYLLGVSPDWTSCTEYRIGLNFDGFLCDIVDLENKYASHQDKIPLTKIKSKIQTLDKPVQKPKNTKFDTLRIEEGLLDKILNDTQEPQSTQDITTPVDDDNSTNTQEADTPVKIQKQNTNTPLNETRNQNKNTNKTHEDTNTSQSTPQIEDVPMEQTDFSMQNSSTSNTQPKDEIIQIIDSQKSQGEILFDDELLDIEGIR